MNDKKFMEFWQKQVKIGYNKYLYTRILGGNIAFVISTLFCFIINGIQLVLSFKFALAYLGALLVVNIIFYIAHSSGWESNQYRYINLISEESNYTENNV
jgi:Zn-dependent protease with chaperone function